MVAGVYIAGTLIFVAMASLMLVVGNGIALVMKNAPTSHAESPRARRPAIWCQRRGFGARV
jgi:hypothetical protein